MAVKRFFDGVSLTEIEIPDGPMPVFTNTSTVHDLITPQNPTGVDPTLLAVDAAQVPDLVPTAGAQPVLKFPEPLPGDGSGAGIGQPSGSVLRDPWANNPNANVQPVDTVQSGEIGSALPEQIQAAPRSGFTDPDVAASTTAQTSTSASAPDASWTKAQLGTYIVENGGTPPASSENKDAFLAAAQEVSASVAASRSDLA